MIFNKIAGGLVCMFWYNQGSSRTSEVIRILVDKFVPILHPRYSVNVSTVGYDVGWREWLWPGQNEPWREYCTVCTVCTVLYSVCTLLFMVQYRSVRRSKGGISSVISNCSRR